MLLAADVGGTKTNVALFDAHVSAPKRPCLTRTYESRRYSDLASILEQFFRDTGHRGADFEAAALGVAGPIGADESQITNLGWRILHRELRERLGLPELAVLNDVEATALGLTVLEPHEFFTLQHGEPPRSPGVRAVLAAGTGLGMAIAPPYDAPIASEYGHTDFAPHTDVEYELVEFFRGRCRPLNAEQFLSGAGLVRIYRFACQHEGVRFDQSLAEVIEDEPSRAPALVLEAGRARRCAAAARALEIFATVCGSVAGNLALSCLPRGGLFLGGGLAPKLRPELAAGGFLEAFLGKDRTRALLLEMPVRVLLNEATALYGAGCAARALTAGSFALSRVQLSG